VQPAPISCAANPARLIGACSCSAHHDGKRQTNPQNMRRADAAKVLGTQDALTSGDTGFAPLANSMRLTRGGISHERFT
jgi:hypothetical protein